MRTLILSDVIGDDMRAIASGPTAEPLGDPAEARQVLQDADLWAEVPQAVRQALLTPEAKAQAVQADNYIIGSNTLALEAMAKSAAKSAKAKICHRALVGDVEDAARIVHDIQVHTDPISDLGRGKQP